MDKPRYNSEGVKLATAATSEYFRQIYRIQDEQKILTERLQVLEDRMHQTVQQLSLSLLPTGDEATVAAAAEALQLDALQVRYAEWEQKRHAWQEERAALLATAEVQQQEQLIGKEKGKWLQALQKREQQEADYRQQLAPYREGAFQRIYARKDQPAPQGLWRWLLRLTGGLKRRQTHEKQFLARVGLTELPQAYRQFEQLDQALVHTLAQVAQLRTNIEALQKQLARLAELTESLDHLDTNRLAALRAEISQFLTHSLTLKLLRKLPANHPRKMLFTQLILLREKIQYLREVEAYLQSEEGDRREHVRKINRVQFMWEKNPYGNLRGDKRKWLVQLPEQRKARTDKVLHWARQVHEPVYYYEDEDGFDLALDAMEEVILYYLITDPEETSTPHRGAVHDLLPTVAMQEAEMEAREEPNDHDDAMAAAASVLAYEALTGDDAITDLS